MSNTTDSERLDAAMEAIKDAQKRALFWRHEAHVWQSVALVAIIAALALGAGCIAALVRGWAQ